MARNSASVLIASFQENYEQLFRFLTRKLGGDHERAADVVQDTYVRLADAHDQGDVIDNPRAYIYRVAGNLAIDGIRREKRITAHHDMDEDTDAIHDPKPGPENIVLDREQILLLDNITSSENVGAIARSMAALGVNSFMLGKSSPHPFNRRALRVSMGYASMLKVHVYEELKESIYALKSLGYTIYAAEVNENAKPLASVRPEGKWVLIMGHEGFGIADDILELCDVVVNIEMQEDVKSFNVAIAASIMMYNFKNK